ncbi:hypothetical protein RHE_PC00074 (plasmid) [Rhizobium etli CFN 42]|uniref:Uncharacterized protein n=1 Tax=Rhizobium etli (strain ATCC 51251 / DSM 11541 / JCM 21823 / NBRC 15573 / CFN 42) TaxID=347834 RepID=Q2K1C1_RHIEC|nr:hypothetical protein RHE_PC00074 [Rhizobium etli CFN 42]
MDPLDSIDGDTDDDGKPDFLDPHPYFDDREILHVAVLQDIGPGAALGLAPGLAASQYEQTQNGDGLLPTQRSAVERIDNRIEEALNEAHFDAVRRERMGQVVAMNPKTGKP